MDNSSQILDFIDGSLDSGAKDKFLQQLSHDENLKSELGEHLTIKNAVKQGLTTEPFPAASKAQLFSTLGLALPDSGQPNIPVGFFNRYHRVIYAGLTTAAALVLLYLFMPTNKIENSVKQSYVQSNLAVQQVPKIESKSNDVVLKAVPDSKQIGKKDYTKTTLADENNISQTSVQNQKEVLPETYNDSKNLTLASPMINHQNSFSGFQNGNFDKATNSVDFTPMISNIPDEHPLGISVELKGSSYWDTKPVSITPEKYSNLNHTSLALFIDLSYNLSIGGEVRQENFSLLYNGFESNQAFNYEQQPNFTTFGAALRYKMSDMGIIQPVGQLTIGGNLVGFVERAMFVAEYSPVKSWSILLGVEYSRMDYQFQNNWFNTSKFGLTYGLSYKF